jgi:hypothetical protein
MPFGFPKVMKANRRAEAADECFGNA